MNLNNENLLCASCTKNGVFIVKNNKTTYLKYQNSNQEPVRIINNSPKKIDYNFNSLQLKMYKTLIYGLNSFSLEEQKALSEESKKIIQKNHKTASVTIQIMKCKILYKSNIKLLSVIFPHLNIGSLDEDWIMDVPRTQTLERLGITIKDVVDEFIRRKLLPYNFYDIKPQIIKNN